MVAQARGLSTESGAAAPLGASQLSNRPSLPGALESVKSAANRLETTEGAYSGMGAALRKIAQSTLDLVYGETKREDWQTVLYDSSTAILKITAENAKNYSMTRDVSNEALVRGELTMAASSLLSLDDALQNDKDMPGFFLDGVKHIREGFQTLQAAVQLASKVFGQPDSILKGPGQKAVIQSFETAKLDFEKAVREFEPQSSPPAHRRSNWPE